MIMRIGFRVDAAKHIGTGHLQRCLTLANYLKAKGHQCIFYCRDYGQAFYNLVLNAGFQLEIIGQTTIGSLPKSDGSLPVTATPDFPHFAMFSARTEARLRMTSFVTKRESIGSLERI